MDILSTAWAGAVPPTKMIVTRWSLDRETLGACSYSGVGSRPSDFDGLREPIANRLFLAGEHTIFDFHGTTHGAYMTGLDAAKMIAEEAG